MRHLFRTACDYAGTKEEGYVRAFMGRKSDVSTRYLESPPWRLEQECEKVEHLLMVYSYGLDEEVRKLKGDVKQNIIQLTKKYDKLGRDYQALSRKVNHFAKSMYLSPEELSAQSEIILECMSKRQIEQDKEYGRTEQKNETHCWL